MADSVLVVTVGLADVRSDPNPTSELVTQALMNVPAIANQISEEWTHVTLSDYEGQNYNCVTINSFDPTAPHYYARLDQIVWGIKRIK